MGDDGMRWDGIAALGYEAYKRSLAPELAVQPWEELPADERAAWIAAAREIARVAFIAASGG